MAKKSNAGARKTAKAAGRKASGRKTGAKVAAVKYYPLRDAAFDVEVSRFIANSDVREECEIIEIREFIEGPPEGNWRTFMPGLTRFQTTTGFPVNMVAAERGEFEIVVSVENGATL